MKPIRIAVCGAPQVGKSTMVEKLSAICGWSEPVRTIMDDAALFELHARIKGCDYLFRTYPGPILYFEKRVTELLKDADLILYVVASCRVEEGDTSQFNFLERYLRIANSLGHDWENGKWILVHNKTDFTGGCSVLEAFPAALRNRMVKTQGLNGFGLDLLLEEIERVAQIAK